MSAPPNIYRQPMEYHPVPSNFNTGVNYPPPPPPYGHMAPPLVQQQQSSNVVVVQSQPTPAVVYTIYPVGDNFLTLSIVLTVICVICGSWFALLCTIPAMIFSTMARDAEQRGEYDTAKTHSRISLGLNIGSLVSWFAIVIPLVITLSVITNRARQSDCYYNTYYEYTYNC